MLKDFTVKRLFMLAVIGLFINAMTLDPIQFDARSQEYGNKTANLFELQTIIASLNQAAGPCDVPAFFGLSDSEIKNFLKSVPDPRLPINNRNRSVYDYILIEWENFKNSQQNYNTITEGASAALENIRNAVIRALDEKEHIVNNALGLEAFLNDASINNYLLMVRSTGREDSSELANAGGNESIAAVQPNITSVYHAIGLVIASYFSEKSISQRIVGQDSKLLSTPFMPVLIQVMIGETGADSSIPVSGVIFSQEPAGNTPGVVDIRATFGHGEAVVNGILPCDTFYISKSGVIHSLIKPKPYRLVPAQDFSNLSQVKNSKKFKNSPCLNKESVSNLAKIALDAERYYGHPVDIEFVVLNNKIYLIQARPIVVTEAKPSYIRTDYLYTISENQKQKASTIVAAESSVKMITSPKEIITARTLGQALDIFLKCDYKNSVQVIIVEEPSPATSHEATTFRSAGKPVLYTKNLNKIKSWISSNSFKILIDTQRELVLKQNMTDSMLSNMLKPFSFLPFLKNNKNHNVIEYGWLNHPICKKLSIFRELGPHTLQTNINPQELHKGINLTQLLNIVKNGTYQEAHDALCSILHRTASKIKDELQKNGNNIEYAKQLKDIFIEISSTIHETDKALIEWERSVKNHQSRLKRLYPTAFLQALFTQNMEPDEFINDFSLCSLIKEKNTEDIIDQKSNIHSKKWRKHLIQYLKADKLAISPETKDNWQKYISLMSKIENAHVNQALASIMLNIASMNMLPFWINTCFDNVITTKLTLIGAICATESLCSEYVQSEDILTQIEELKNKLCSFPIDLLEDPKKFEKQWKYFNDNFVNKFCDTDFLEKMCNNQTLSSSAAISIMKSFVDIFDTSIKSMKGSTQYTDNAKVKNFKKMLNDYLDVLEFWSKIKYISYELSPLASHSDMFTYISRIKALLALCKENTTELQPSAYFNVAGAMLGSGAFWDRSVYGTVSAGTKISTPTLEDVFTLIHQNLLVIVGQLTKKAIEPKIKLPELMKTFDSYNNAGYYRKHLIGIKYEHPILVYYYNMPLNNHSSTIQTIYNCQTEETCVSVQFIGDARSRWSNIYNMVNAEKELQFSHAPELNVERGMVSWCWKATSKYHIEKIVEIIEKCAVATF